MTSNDVASEEILAQETTLEEPQDLSVYVPEKVRKPGEIGFAIICLVFGILGYYFAMDMTSENYSSPSVFPKIASIVIICCSAITLYKAIKRERPPAGETIIGYLLPKDVIVMLLMLIAYCVALPNVGFIISSYVFMVAGMIYLHRGKKIIHSLIYSVIALVILVVVFRYLFLVILP